MLGGVGLALIALLRLKTHGQNPLPPPRIASKTLDAGGSVRES